MNVRNTQPQVVANSSPLWHYFAKKSGLIGVCVYLIGFGLPLGWDIPLVLLSICAAFAVFVGTQQLKASWPPLIIPILLLIASIALSTLVSKDVGRSIRLSIPLLPALLIFFLISQHIQSLNDLRTVILSLCVVTTVILCMVVWNIEYRSNGQIDHAAITSRMGSPLLVVPNDIAFLAVIAPLSLALFYHNPRSLLGIFAILSILVSIGIICAFKSRTAALTMIIALTCAVFLMQSKQQWTRAAIYGLGFCLLVLLIDGLFNFQFTAKFIRKWGEFGRPRWYWSTAWTMFLEAPLLGKGAHTFGLFHRTPWPHNLYLEVLAEQGILGLAVLISLLGSGMWAVWRTYRSATGEIRLMSAGFLAALIGFCSAAVFELSLVRLGVVIVLFVLLGGVARLTSLPQQGRISGA